MAVTVKSTLVSNYDASPRVLSNPYQAGGGDTVGTALCAVGSGDGAGSIYRFAFVPSGARLTDLRIMNDALTTGSSYKFGVLNNTQDGGAVVAAGSDQIFASTISLVAARNVWTDILFPSILSAGGLVANTGLRIWELLGLASDPFKEYHLAMTAVTASTVNGNVALAFAWVR